MVIGIAFIAGTLLGSFINVVVLRYGTAASSLRGRSACPHCGRQLRWWELLPVVSFVGLRGKCARCGAKLSWHYPMVEIAMGLLTMLLVLQSPVGTHEWLSVFTKVGMLGSLLVLGLIDRRTFLLPDVYIGVLSIFVVLHLVVTRSTDIGSIGGGAVFGSAFLLFLWLITRGRGIGLGDVKLLVPLGALFGLSGTAVFLFLSFCAGAVVSLLLLARGTATMKTAIPFGPFLTSVAILLILWPQIIAACLAVLLI